jgi:hypothetical protein
MSHARQQLREQVAAALTGLSLTGTRVFQSRFYPLERTDLPGILVFIDEDSIDYMSMSASPILKRETLVRVQAVAKANADLDDTLDTISAQIETAMHGASLSAKSKNFIGTQIDIDSSGEQPVGTSTLTYRMMLFTTQADPQTAL